MLPEFGRSPASGIDCAFLSEHRLAERRINVYISYVKNGNLKNGWRDWIVKQNIIFPSHNQFRDAIVFKATANVLKNDKIIQLQNN